MNSVHIIKIWTSVRNQNISKNSCITIKNNNKMKFGSIFYDLQNNISKKKSTNRFVFLKYSGGLVRIFAAI